MLEKIYRHSHDCIVLLDRHFNFIRVNQAYADVCKRDVGEFAGHNHFEFYPSPLVEDFKKVVETGIPYQAFTRPFIFPDHPEWGETYWDLSLAPIPDSNGEVEFLLFTLKDVTERHRAELSLRRANRALRAIGACNSLLIRATNEQELLDGMCKVVVGVGGYLMAWVGFAETDEGKTVRPVARSGYEERYLDTAEISWGDNELGRGPTGTAIRTKSTQINQNCLTNPRMRPWLEAALQRGYQSSIALPLVYGDVTLGVLTIYAAEPEAFQDEEVALLERLTGDLAYGIYGLRSSAAHKKAEDKLQESEERYHQLFENGTDAIALADAETGELIDVNHAMEKLVDREKSEIIGKPQKMLHPSEPGQDSVSSSFERHRSDKEGEPIETQIVTRSGMVREVEIKASSIHLNDRKVLLGFFRDISERKRYEAQLEYQATHDSLTGLANRSLLTDRFELSIAHSRRAERWVAAMLLGLDRLKLINDSLGHDTGDVLIREVARRLSACMRPGDTAARLGGDEFVVVMSDLSSEEDAVALARKLLDFLAQPVTIGGREIVVSASMGVSIYPRDGELPSMLLKNADVAMCRAKETGGNSFQFYSPEMNVRMLERLELENKLRRALDRKEFELYYQPKVDLSRGHISGAEALIRWNHPELGRVPPGEFIPIAEETGLIVPIGEWAIKETCGQIRAWRDGGLPAITVAVNLSAKQFRQGKLAEVVERGLREAGIQPQYLELEVTESAVMSNPKEAISILQELKRIGVQISLDDFGTGYSSLNYLKRFPVDTLKIDQSFVRDITTDPDDAAITRLVIALAHGMKRKVIAEGVETEAQLKFLQRGHCDEMQGYFFSKPVPSEEFASLLRNKRELEVAVDPSETMRTLLIVEDEANIVASLKRLFQNEGYRILSAGSAAEGLEMLALHKIQVIISDQRMPQMSGTEFLSRVWQIYPDTIRILLTGYTDLNSVTEAVNRGAILKFLTKPWEDDQLREHIREAFRFHESKERGNPAGA
ncbi:MAG: EAL domain-containing protein [Burkholderiales bacterium]|nr:EAL domain-containing protein [Burkholderiales bacterium]